MSSAYLTEPLSLWRWEDILEVVWHLSAYSAIHPARDVNILIKKPYINNYDNTIHRSRMPEANGY